MKHKLLKLARLVAGFSAGISVIFGVALWRLSQGPVSLDYVTPALERALTVQANPYAVRIETTVLAWGGWRRLADLRMRNVRLLGTGGNVVALFPDVSVGISLQALSRRKLALSRIEVHGLVATVERSLDGRFALALPSRAAAEMPGDLALRDATEAVLRLVRAREGPARDIHRIAVVDARLRYVDRKNGRQWLFPQATVSANLLAAGFDVRLGGLLEFEGRRGDFTGAVLYDAKSGRGGGRVDFHGVHPRLLAQVLPELEVISALAFPFSGHARFDFMRSMALSGLRLDLSSAVGNVVIDMAYPRAGGAIDASATLRGLRVAMLARSTQALASLAGFDVPVDGRIAGRFDPEGRLHLAQVDLTAGAGRIATPGYADLPLPVRGGRLRAAFADGLESAEIQEAWLDIGRTRLGGTAKVDRVRGDFRVRGVLELKALEVGDLGRFWPSRFAKGARRWVHENILAGVIRKARANVVLHLPASSPADAIVESVNGKFSYEGLNIRYWSPLPAAVDVAGTANFDENSLRFVLTQGNFQGVVIERGEVGITGLAEGMARIVIQVGLRGAARNFLNVLDRPPLKFATRVGVSPDAVRGKAIVHGRIEFPLDETFNTETVDFQVRGSVGNVALDPAPYGLTVEGSEVQIEADRRNMKMTGDIMIGHLPATIVWAEQFAGNAASRRIELTGRVPDLGKIGLGLPKLEFIEGPADARVVITSTAGEAAEVGADFDFAGADLSIPHLGWRKTRGEPGRASLRIHTDGADGIQIDGFRIETSDTLVEGAAARTAQGTWRVVVNDFKQPGSRFSGTVDVQSDQSLSANLRGARFDLAAIFAAVIHDADGRNQSGGPLRRLKVGAAFDAITWGKEKLVTQAQLNMLRGAGGIEGLMLEGRTRARGKLGVKYLPGPEGFRFDIEASDFGALLAGILPQNRVAGGSLVIRGHVPSSDGTLRGAFVVKEFTVRKAPTLARLLQVVSLTGIVEALSKKGLNFDEFEGTFEYADGTLSIDRSRAFGSSIGITLRGDISVLENKVALVGTLVPAYTFNRMLGAVPLVGTLLTGGTDEGLFAATYSVTGPLDKPAVNVNPLSALSPGFLRNLFGGPAHGENDTGVSKNPEAPD